jgi:hypothetical protein
MSGRSIADAVLAHIGHAERWLRRARADYERGDLRQVVLRLLLAEAEIRRARESGEAIAELPPRRPAHLALTIAAAVAVAGLILAGYALIQPYAAGPLAQVPDQTKPGHDRGGLTGIVRFDTGQVLPFVAFPGRTGATGTAPGPTAVEMDRLVTIGDDGPAFVPFR